tara:strand:- start:1877 stop:3271 length:1395 start_codon:yes stop_codon:yes gene_type:complete
MLSKFTALLGVLACINAHPFSNCNSNSIGIESVQLTPDPPVTNSNLQVTLNGTSSQDVIKPIVHLEINVYDIPVYHMDIDVCSTNACPALKNTPYSFNFNYKIPNEHLSGINIDVKLTISDKTITVGCIDLQTNINYYNGLFNEYIAYRPLAISDHGIEYLFHHWINHYNKKYTTVEEYKTRFNIFKTNTLYILNHRHTSFTLGHNIYSDLSPVEFKYRLGYKPNINKNIDSKLSTSFISNTALKQPTNSIDWRNKGAVTPVKNQGQCGSCWSFSTTGAIEGAYFLKTGNLVSFSEQELVSCDNTDQGCNGGLMDNAFEWIHNHSGLCSESEYPYNSGNGQSDTCTPGCSPIENSTVLKYIDVPENTLSLEQAVSRQPVSVAIEADHLSFQLYSKGVYHSDCGTSLDHGVLIVGYGTLNSLDYWIVKNSWGEQWGNNGYIYIQKNRDSKGGECGIQLSASYPVL